MLAQDLKVLLDILRQGDKSCPLMSMGDCAARPAPEPFDAVGVRGICGCADDPQMVLQLGQRLAYQLGAPGGRGPQIGHDDYSDHGWRGWHASPSQDHLPPQAFPTEPGCSSALRLRGQVERWQT
jgi:hypothetical protein